MSNTNEVQNTIDEILAYRCPRYEQLPDLTLYSDQVIDALKRSVDYWRNFIED